MDDREAFQRARKAGDLLEAAALSERGLRGAFHEVAGLFNSQMFQLFNFTNVESPDMIVSSVAGSSHLARPKRD